MAPWRESWLFISSTDLALNLHVVTKGVAINSLPKFLLSAGEALSLKRASVR